MNRRPTDGPFSFVPDDSFLADIPLQTFEVGLEIAALEERHYERAGLPSDATISLIERLSTVRKLRETLAELQEGIASADQDAREYALNRYTARIMRAAFEAGRRHDPAASDSDLDELVDLFRRKIHLGAVSDEALTSGGSCGTEPYWTYEQIDQARRIVRLEDDPDARAFDEAEDSETGGAA